MRTLRLIGVAAAGITAYFLFVLSVGFLSDSSVFAQLNPPPSGGSGSKGATGATGVTGATGSTGTSGTIPVACGGSSDAAAVQAALTSAGGHVVLSATAGTCAINTPLTIYSNTWLDAGTVAVYNSATNGPTLIQNFAYQNTAGTLSGAAITAASTALTVSGGLTSANIGQSIVIPGAGGGSGSTFAVLCATITAVSSGTAGTLSIAAVTTVSGKTATLYNRDSNIKITGGNWKTGGSSRTGLSQLIFRRVDGLMIDGLTVTNPSGEYAIYPGDVTSATVRNIFFNNAVADGVHVEGPATGLTIQNISGTTIDDSVALTCIDTNGQFDDVSGSFSGVLIDNVNVSSLVHAILILGGNGTTHTNETVTHVWNNNSSTGAALQIGGTYGLITYGTPTTIDGFDGDTLFGFVGLKVETGGRLTLRDIYAGKSTNTTYELTVSATSVISSLSVDGIYLGANANAVSAILVDTGASVTQLITKNITATRSTSAMQNFSLMNASGTVVDWQQSNIKATYSNSVANVAMTGIYGTVTSLERNGIAVTTGNSSTSLDDLHVNAGATLTGVVASDLQYTFADSASNALAVQGTGILSDYRLSNVNMQLGNLLLSFQSSTSTVGPGSVSNSILKGSQRIGNFQTGGTVNLTLDGLTITTLGSAYFFIGATTTLNLRGAGTFNNSSHNAFQFSAGAIVNLLNTDFPASGIPTTAGTSGTFACTQRSAGLSSCYLNGYAQTGTAATYTYPIPFSTTPVLQETAGSCGTFNPTTTATVLTLPANAAMTAETCNVVVTGQ